MLRNCIGKASGLFQRITLSNFHWMHHLSRPKNTCFLTQKSIKVYLTNPLHLKIYPDCRKRMEEHFFDRWPWVLRPFSQFWSASSFHQASKKALFDIPKRPKGLPTFVSFSNSYISLEMSTFWCLILSLSHSTHTRFHRTNFPIRFVLFCFVLLNGAW